MLILGLRRGYVPPRVKRMRKKNATPGDQIRGCQISRCVYRDGRRDARTFRADRLLHVNQEVSLKDVLSLFVFLGLFVRFIIFPAECGAALAAIDVSHSMLSSCHLALVRFALNNVNHIFKQVRATMLPIESPRYHRVNGSEMSAAAQATIYAGTRQVTSITHAHDERGDLGGLTASNGVGVKGEREGQGSCEDRQSRLI